MTSQRRTVGELFPTRRHFTDVRTDASVDVLVLRKTGLPRELLTTRAAFERADACVNHVVPDEVVRENKRRATYITHVAPLFGVRAHVLLEM